MMLMLGYGISRRGDNAYVYIRSFDGKNKWLPGTATTRQGPLSFRIILDDDRVVQRHIDHIRSQECTDLPVETTTSFDDAPPTPREHDSTEQ